MKNNLTEQECTFARKRFMDAHELALGATSQWLTEQKEAQTPDEGAWTHVMRSPTFERAWAEEVSEHRIELIQRHAVRVTRESIFRRNDLTPARRLLLLALDPSMVDIYQISAPRPDWDYGRFFAIFNDGSEGSLLLTQTPGGFVSDFITLIVNGYDQTAEGVKEISARTLQRLVWSAWQNGGPDAKDARALLCKTVQTILGSYEQTFEGASFIASAGLKVAAFHPDAVLAFGNHAPVNQLSSEAAPYVRPSKAFQWNPIGALDVVSWEILHGSERRTIRAPLPYREKYAGILRKSGCDQGMIVTKDAKFILLTHRDHVDWDGMSAAERIAV